MASRKILRLAARAALVLAAVYVLFLTAVYVAMIQPPDRFGRFMSKLPGPLYPAIPFERMWNVARAGKLEVGDEAPDFDLRTADKSARVRLSSFRGRQPVVLVFGSYT
jgi:hypothetical protein